MHCDCRKMVACQAAANNGKVSHYYIIILWYFIADGENAWVFETQLDSRLLLLLN